MGRNHLRCAGAVCLVSGLSFLYACGDASGTTDDTKPSTQIAVRPSTPPPGEAIVLIQPEATIEAGTEKMLCWVVDWVPEQDVLIEHLATYQGKMGHHALAFASIVPRAAGEVFECTNPVQMTSIRPLIAAEQIVRGDESEELDLLPDNMVVRVAAGTVIVIQSHYVNSSTQDVQVSDAVKFSFAQPSEQLVEASYYAHVDLSATASQGDSTATSVCEFSEETTFAVITGHMHDWGTSITIERERAGESLEFYNVERWSAEYRDYPPITTYTRQSPLTFRPGDVARLTCNYSNNAGRDIGFPEEMCAWYGVYFPARPDGFLNCVATPQ